MEHLYPQEKIGTYQNLTNANYQVAISYYQQRRSNLLRNFNNQAEISFEKILKYVENSISEKWIDIVTKRVNNALLRGAKVNNNYTYSVKGFDNENDKYSIYVNNVLNQIAKNNASNPKALLGDQFEVFLENEVFGAKVSSIIDGAVDSTLSSLLGLVGSGSETSKSALTKNGAKIRPDLIMGVSIKNPFSKDSNGVLRENKNNLAIELTELIDLSQMQNDVKLENNSILKQYLASGVYGFSVKQWNNPTGKTFAKSSVLQENLNNTFSQVDKYGNLHPWEASYAEDYQIYVISKSLINLIGPINVALINGQNVSWVDDFLQTHLFNMRLIFNNAFKDPEKGTMGNPEITKSDVYIRTLQNAEHRYFVRASKIKDGKTSISIRTAKANSV